MDRITRLVALVGLTVIVLALVACQEHPASTAVPPTPSAPPATSSS